jgi:hypothetical protein
MEVEQLYPALWEIGIIEIESEWSATDQGGDIASHIVRPNIPAVFLSIAERNGTAFLPASVLRNRSLSWLPRGRGNSKNYESHHKLRSYDPNDRFRSNSGQPPVIAAGGPD